MNGTVQKIGSTALLALVLLGPGASGRPHHSPPSPPAVETASTSQGREFVIRGKAVGLFPGVRRRMKVTVVNRTRRPITVTRIRAAVGNANRLCGPTTLRIRPFRGSLRIRAGARRRIRLHIRMRRDAPDACQGARYPIRFTGWRRTP